MERGSIETGNAVKKVKPGDRVSVNVETFCGECFFCKRGSILNVYSHILDDDRRKNAELFEKAFYEKKELEPDIHQKMPENTMQVPEGVDRSFARRTNFH